MAKTIQKALDELLGVNGAMCVALVDSSSGMMLGSAGTGLDLDVAAAGNTELVRAKLRTIQSLGMKDSIEDILITLGKQYHIIRPITSNPAVFVYCVIDRKGNLAMARLKLASVEKEIVVG